MEFLVQPADGAVLSCSNRQPLSVLGLRRAARLRRDGGSEPNVHTTSITDARFPRRSTSAVKTEASLPDPLRSGRSSSAARIPTTSEDLDIGQEQVIDPTLDVSGSALAAYLDAAARVSPVDKHALYFEPSADLPYRDGGNTGASISPDLTRRRPRRIIRRTSTRRPSRTAAALPRRGVVYAIAPSPLSTRICSGPEPTTARSGSRTTAARIGTTSRRATDARGAKSASSRPRTSIVTRAYLAIDRHRLDDYTPYIYRTH